MGRALVGGMLSGSVIDARSVHVVEPSAESRQWWSKHHPNVAVDEDSSAAVLKADIVLLAVKPNVIPAVAQQPGESGKSTSNDAALTAVTVTCAWRGKDSAASAKA